MSRLHLLAGKRDPWSPWVMPRSVLRGLWASDARLTQADGAVSAWTDQINSLAPIQATGSLQPAYDASGAYPVVRGDGTDDRLAVESTGSLPVGTDPWFVVAVVSGWALGVSTNARMVTWGGTTSATARRLGYNPTLGALVLSNNGGQNLTVAAPLVAPSIVVAVVSSDGVFLRVNGVEIGRNAATALTGTTGTTRTRLFGDTSNAPGAFGNGAMSDLAIGTILSDLNVLRFEGYYAQKRGIALPADHPYARSAP